MRRLLVAVSVIIVLLVVAAGASAVLGVGPLARGAAVSVVYVAVSRSTDEADAREIEAIDLAAGTRELFDAGGKITAMALSRDRRSLSVAVDGGRVAFLDAVTGITFAAADLRGPAGAAGGGAVCGPGDTPRSGGNRKTAERRAGNPHFRFAEAQRKGYGVAE